ncbi:hypothetical protein ACQ4LE_005528 [Meloidogyne hapla]
MISFFSKPHLLFIIPLCFLTSVNCLLGTYNFNQPVQFNRLFKWDPIQQLANNNLIMANSGISSFYQNPNKIHLINPPEKNILTDEMLQKEIQEILPKIIKSKPEGYYRKYNFKLAKN